MVYQPSGVIQFQTTSWRRAAENYSYYIKIVAIRLMRLNNMY